MKTLVKRDFVQIK